MLKVPQVCIRLLPEGMIEWVLPEPKSDGHRKPRISKTDLANTCREAYEEKIPDLRAPDPVDSFSDALQLPHGARIEPVVDVHDIWTWTAWFQGEPVENIVEGPFKCSSI
jgi:hypothetical protein